MDNKKGKRRFDFAGCPRCMDGPGIQKGHAYCHYPSPEWQRLWDEGKAEVTLINSTWYIHKGEEEDLLEWFYN